MKKFLSLALALIMTLSLVTISAGATEYKDFTDKDEIQYEEAVAVLNRLGIITGYSEGDFRPEGELTRGAAAKIIVSLMIGPEAAEALPTTGNPYPDVPAGNVFAGYIGFCKTSGIISGYGDGTFRPNGTLTGYAFSKMLLGALGYKSEFEGLSGDGWTMNVANLGNQANLFNRIDFKGGETVNRETACQLALNTLKATMVEYTGGMNITTDAGSMVVNPDRTYVISNQEYAKNISNRKASQAGNALSDNHYTVEFGEEHFKDLRMSHDRTTEDGFGRPSNEWSYKKVTIGTYPIEPDFTYTTQVIHCVEGTTNASKVRALGLNGYNTDGKDDPYRGPTTTLWENGVPKTITEVADIANYTDNGTLVEVYVSDEDADFISDVVVVKTQLMEVKRVGSDYVALDIYDDSSDADGKQLFGYNSVPIDVDVNDVETEDDYYDLLKGLKAGDLVAVVPVAPDNDGSGKYDVAKAYVPETASGSLTRVETYGQVNAKSAVAVTVGGTKYNIALWNKDLHDIDGDIVKITKKDVTLILDEYGNALRAKDVGETNNWMVIKNYRQGLVNGIIVTYANGLDIGGEELSLNIGGGDVADTAKNTFKPGDLVHYSNNTSSNTAEWVLSNNYSNPDQTHHGVFNVAQTKTDSEGKVEDYTIKASNTTLKLDGFNDIAKTGSDLATIDTGIKFIYVNIDPTDKEVDSIEIVSGVKATTTEEIKGDKSNAAHPIAQACVSLKTSANVVNENSAVKAVVIKRESAEASVSNLLYISHFMGSAEQMDKNNDVVYGYRAVMMGPGGKMIDDDVEIYSYKKLNIGDFARYSKMTTPEAASSLEGVTDDNFYSLTGYGISSPVSSNADTYQRSAAVASTSVTESLKQSKYLLRTNGVYSNTRAAAYPDIHGKYEGELDLGDTQAEDLLNSRPASWVDLRQTGHKIEDVDDLKDYLEKNPTMQVDVTVLFNDNRDNDEFRHAYLIVVTGVSKKAVTPGTSLLTIKDDDTGFQEGFINGTRYTTLAAMQAVTVKAGDKVEVRAKTGYTVTPSGEQTVPEAGLTITIAKSAAGTGTVRLDTDSYDGYLKNVKGTIRPATSGDTFLTMSFEAPDWATICQSGNQLRFDLDLYVDGVFHARMPITSAATDSATTVGMTTHTYNLADLEPTEYYMNDKDVNFANLSGDQIGKNLEVVITNVKWSYTGVKFVDKDDNLLTLSVVAPLQPWYLTTAAAGAQLNPTSATITIGTTYDNASKPGYTITGAKSVGTDATTGKFAGNLNAAESFGGGNFVSNGNGWVIVKVDVSKKAVTEYTLTSAAVTSGGYMVDVAAGSNAATVADFKQADGTTANTGDTRKIWINVTGDGITADASNNGLVKFAKTGTRVTFHVNLEKATAPHAGEVAYDVVIPVVDDSGTVVATFNKRMIADNTNTANTTATFDEFVNYTVTGNLVVDNANVRITPVIGPKLSGAEQWDNASKSVVLVFDKPVDLSTVDAGDFIIKFAGGAAQANGNCTIDKIDETHIKLTISGQAADNTGVVIHVDGEIKGKEPGTVVAAGSGSPNMSIVFATGTVTPGTVA